jgi:hypothetical protein
MTPYLGDTVTWLSDDIDPNTPAGLVLARRYLYPHVVASPKSWRRE